MGIRIRDIILATLGILLLSWLFLLIILLLFLTQKRVFFRQERTGYREKPFRLIKFSTLRDILPGEDEDTNQQIRLRPPGKILRRFSLDEMPQLFLVLTGKMSLVGPRPLFHDYLPLYSQRQKKRFQVRPGITGWAQIHGRNRISFTERFELDVWYVEHQSFGLDMKILMRTFQQLIKGKDVYSGKSDTSVRFDGKN